MKGFKPLYQLTEKLNFGAKKAKNQAGKSKAGDQSATDNPSDNISLRVCVCENQNYATNDRIIISKSCEKFHGLGFLWKSA